MKLNYFLVLFFCVIIGCDNSNKHDECFHNTNEEICKILNTYIEKDFRVPCVIENDFSYNSYNGKVKNIFCRFNLIKNKIDNVIIENKINNKNIDSIYLSSQFDSLENLIKNDFSNLFPDNGRNLTYYDTIFKTNLNTHNKEYTLNYLSKLQVDINILQYRFLWHLCNYDNEIFNKNEIPKFYTLKYENNNVIKNYIYFGTNYLENGLKNYFLDTIIFLEVLFNEKLTNKKINMEYDSSSSCFKIENCDIGNYKLKGYILLRKENDEQFKVDFNHCFKIL